jgi:N-glycosylase/DNA lyase
LLALDHPSDGDEVVYHLFPQPAAFPDEGLEAILRDLGFGYRAGFLDATLAVLRAEGPVVEALDAMRGGELATTRERLVRLKGIGKKVADCIGLMCMDQVRNGWQLV